MEVISPLLQGGNEYLGKNTSPQSSPNRRGSVKYGVPEIKIAVVVC
jgi:hypothetical protein